MTALVLENLAVLPAQVQSLRTLLSWLSRAIDALVRARALRAVPEWRMREVQGEIQRHLGNMTTARKRRTAANATFDNTRSESANRNFGR